MKPGKWKRSAMPRCATSAIILSIMSPLPAMQKRMFFVRCSTMLAASTKYSGPFCIVSLPRNVTTFSLGLRSGTMSRMSFDNGVTALCTVDTFLGSWKYLLMTICRVSSLTHMMWSALSMPSFSMP